MQHFTIHRISTQVVTQYYAILSVTVRAEKLVVNTQEYGCTRVRIVVCVCVQQYAALQTYLPQVTMPPLTQCAGQHSLSAVLWENISHTEVP